MVNSFPTKTSPNNGRPRSNKGRGKPLPVRKMKKSKKAPSSSPVAALINDPCGAKIPDRVYGDDSGYSMRLKLTRTADLYNNTAHRFGYVVWFPDYHNISRNGNATVAGTNFFQWNSTDSQSRPVSLGFGAQSTATTTPTTTSSITDPAYNFVAGETCQDARTLAACLKVRYVGTTSNARGNFYPLVNVPLELLINDLPNVSEMVQYATQEIRADDNLEIKHRPSTRASGNYHNQRYGPIGCATGVAPSLYASAEAQGPVGIGFVWFDISSPVDVFFDAYKVIEWKPEANSGIPLKPPRGGFTTETVRNAINFLDTRLPGWEAVVSSVGGGAAMGLTTLLRRVVLGGAH